MALFNANFGNWWNCVPLLFMFEDSRRVIRSRTDIAMAKDKRTNNDLQNTTHKTKDRVTRTLLKLSFPQ